MTTIGICLSGCGVQDGAEIHESVLTLLALDRENVKITFMAPNVNQTQVVDHCSGNKTSETRNVLQESARIARGNIVDVKSVKAKDIDGLIFPGGFGAALNLCNFATAGKDCSAQADVAKLIESMHAAGKPIGAICIAPALIAKVLSKKKVKVTIGTDASTAQAIEAMGAIHQNCAVNEIVVDETNKVVTTPAYMLAQRVSEAAQGIDKLVKKVVQLAQKK